MRNLLILSLALLLPACAADNDEALAPKGGTLVLTTSVGGFTAEDRLPDTRTNVEGNAFALGDRIKLKIICPYVDHTNFGETTYGNTADGFWLLKWAGTDWTLIQASDSVDVAAQYKYTESYNLFGHYEAQQTPYVYTASTWNENVLFIAPNYHGAEASSFFSQYSYLFHADQSTRQDYQKCDLLWAQTYMQTGNYNVHLAFNHVMACLEIDISDLGLSDSTVVTLENMPDIDMCEVVVGDYYAPKAKNITQAYPQGSGSNYDYSYRQKCSCDPEHNGKVLGVAVINDATAKAEIHTIKGNPVNSGNNSPTYVANTGVYTAYKAAANTYRLIVPPCDLTDETLKPTLWIRNGEKRYSYPLTTTRFEQGKLYPVNILLTAPVTPDPADEDNNDDNNNDNG